MSDNSDFHNSSFDEGTLTKLKLYEEYIETAVAVFLASPSPPSEIHIHDYFSGPGINKEGQWGSPLLALDVILKMKEAKQTASLWSNKSFFFHFSDLNSSSIEMLKENIEKQFSSQLENITILYSHADFDSIFHKNISKIQSRNTANIILLDQFGVSEIKAKHIQEISKAYFTDTLIFTASSSVNRFKEQIGKTLRKNGIHIPAISSIEECHDALVKGFSKIKTERKMYFGGFSFNKKPNIYGLIFCSASIKGIVEFLKTCWKMDPEKGKSDYRPGPKKESRTQSVFLFESMAHIESLQEDLKDYIINEKPKGEEELLMFCIDRWMNPSDCKPVLQALKKEGYLTTGFQVPQCNKTREIIYT